MAISTYKTFLMIKGESNTYTKLVDISEFPDLGGDPEMIDVTTLSDGMQVNIMGILSNDGLTFNGFYDKTKYQELVALEGAEHDFAVWFGGTESGGVVTPTGENGKFSFPGEIRSRVTGGGVNEAVGLSITIAATAPIAFSAS